MDKQEIDNYFTKNEKQIRKIISMSKSKFDKDVIFSNVYINCINCKDKINDLYHLEVYIKRYVYQLYYWYKSRSIELTESLISQTSSSFVNDIYSLDESFNNNSNNGFNTDDDNYNDERLIDYNTNIEFTNTINDIYNKFEKTLNTYELSLFKNWIETDITKRTELTKLYNTNYKYTKQIQQELFSVLDKLKQFITEQ